MTMSCLPCKEGFSQGLVEVGHAYDILVVQSESGDFYSNSDFFTSFETTKKPKHRLWLQVGTSDAQATTPRLSISSLDTTRIFEIPPDISSCDTEDEVWPALGKVLKPGKNPATYLVSDGDCIVGMAHMHVFLYSCKDKIMISDIDGTISKSTTIGIYDTILTEQYNHCHEGICELYSKIATHANVQVIYLTSRPVALASCTRHFLEHLRQKTHGLPAGPILGFNGNFAQLLWMEVVTHQTQRFKADRLWKTVVQPFRQAGCDPQLFLGAFGNTLMDCQAYSMVGVRLKNIYLIENSMLHSFDKDKHEESYFIAKTSDPDQPYAPERPKRWYRSKMGTSFMGYPDRNLLEHVLS